MTATLLQSLGSLPPITAQGLPSLIDQLNLTLKRLGTVNAILQPFIVSPPPLTQPAFVPTQRWVQTWNLPTGAPVGSGASVSDNFNGLGNNPLSGRSPWVGEWFDMYGSYPSYNSVSALAGVGNLVRSGGAGLSADQFARCTMVLVGAEYAGPAVRIATGASSGYAAATNNAQTKIIKVVATAVTTLASGGPPCAPGDTLECWVVGTRVSCRVNGTEVLSATDATLAAGGPGVYGDGGSNFTSLDDFFAQGVASGAATVAQTALFLDVTDTSSPAASLLMDLQVGGVSKFSVRKDGLMVGTFGAVTPMQFGALGDDATDDSAAINAAIATGRPVDLLGRNYRAHGLVQTADFQTIFSSTGFASITKNANGDLFTSSGDDVKIRNIGFRGESVTPAFTGHNVVASGYHFQLLGCGSRWAYARAVLSTGDSTIIRGTGDIYQTADASATGYDIEIGVSGTATLFHEISGIYTSQHTGGIKTVDCGSLMVKGVQFGKLTIASGTGPAGTNGGTYTGCRIHGDVTVGISNANFAACQFADIDFVINTGVTGVKVDATSSWQSGSTLTNNGGGSNHIERSVGSGSTIQILYGADGANGLLDIDSGLGRFIFGTGGNAAIGLLNGNAGFIIRNAANSADGFSISMNSSHTVFITNNVTDATILHQTTGTGSGSRHQFGVGGSNRMFIDNNGIQGHHGSNAAFDFYIGGARKAGLSVTAADVLRWTDSSGTVKLQLQMGGNTAAFVPPSTSVVWRNNADNATNLTITDAGLATFRNKVTTQDGTSRSSNALPSADVIGFDATYASAATSGGKAVASFYGDQTAASTGNLQALQGYVRLSQPSGTTAAVWGINAGAEFSGAGTVTDLRGGDFRAFLNGSGTVTRAAGITGRLVFLSGNPHVVEGASLYLHGWNVLGGTPTIDTAYGIQIEDVTAGTLNYAIKTGLGKVSFGDTVSILKSPLDFTAGVDFVLGTTDNKHLSFKTNGSSRWTVTNIGELTPDVTNGAKLWTKASASGGAGFTLPHGAAPSSPVNGDLWTTTAGLYVRINGTTVGPLT